MDRLARLRTRSSASGPLNASTTSSLAAGYETANDESLTSGSGSLYFSMTEGNGTKSGVGVEEGGDEDGLTEEPTLSGTLATSGHSGVDQTLENDFSVEEVSTIRKATIAVASPATVQVAAGMAVKYLGVSSTPAPKTPKSLAKKEDLSGFDQLEQTPSIMKKMRDPKTPADSSFGDDPEETTLDGSGIQGPPPGNKSYGTNVLANFFATLDVNSGTPVPVPEIKINEPEVPPAAAGTTPNKRDSNSLENFFESLKKNPAPEVPAARPRKSLSVRKSLIPKVAAMAATSKQNNRVASPISRNKSQTATGAVRLLPEKLREMRKTTHNADQQLVQFRQRKSVVPAAAAVVGDGSAKGTATGGGLRKSMAVAAVKTVTTATAASAALKRKSVMPTAAVNGRKSVLPPAVKRGVVSATGVPSRSVALKIPAKTTLSNGPDGTNNNGPTSSTHHRRTLLGKRPATTLTATASLPEKLTTTSEQQPPVAKQQRKSLAAPKEPLPQAVRVSPRNKPVTAPPQASRIRPPSTTTAGAAGFKKPETFTCDQCQRIFRLRSSYETHVKTVHQQQPSTPSPTPASPSKSASDGAKCQYCGKGFAGAKFLANHVVSNCVKIPLLEKRRLLAEGEAERAANVKRSTPEAAGVAGLAKKRQSTMMRPMANRSATSSTRSGDEETDTSTCSTGSGGGGGGGGGRKRAASATGSAGSGGGGNRGGGISRTPNKELKCHLCARRFLNAVEYALHVQAHTKNAMKGGAGGGGGDGEDVENAGKVQLEQTEDVVKLVQKLATLKNRNGGKVVGAMAAAPAALKSSNSNVGGGK